jgi:hypothetical protein
MNAFFFLDAMDVYEPNSGKHWLLVIKQNQ